MVILTLNCTTDFKIVDDKGKEYSIEEARKLFESNQILDYNLAFQRLVRYDWDLEGVKTYYKIATEMENITER